MLNYFRTDYKKAVLNSGIDKEVAKAHYHDFAYGSTDSINALREVYGSFVVDIALQLNNARYKRKQRVEDRIGSYISIGHCVFLTLTFKDDVLKSTTSETRRKYVRRFLKKYCPAYVANIDFGGRNGREHYHALVVGDNLVYKEWHKYGAIKGEKVRNTDGDIERTCKYVAKLSNHALKVDGCAPRLIYSRSDKKAYKAFWEDPPF